MIKDILIKEKYIALYSNVSKLIKYQQRANNICAHIDTT